MTLPAAITLGICGTITVIGGMFLWLCLIGVIFSIMKLPKDDMLWQVHSDWLKFVTFGLVKKNPFI